MIQVRRSEDRGRANYGWLKTFHTFSFANYYDPNHTGFHSLKVINEDVVEPAQGFSQHGHRNMEILTYIINGQLEHKDSLGTGSTISRGDVQRMSAGKGVLHSEFNPSSKEKVHLLQIWILPSKQGLEPSYEQKNFSEELKKNKLCLLVSPTGEQGSLTIHQDAKVFASTLEEKAVVEYNLSPSRKAWVQIIRGSLLVSTQTSRIEVFAGDGLSIEKTAKIEFKAFIDSEFLLFDLV